MKRAFDLLVSFISLILLSPFFLLLAVLIKLDSPGPVFYRGVRVGRHGKPFRIFKFRSMVREAEKSGVSSTGARDARVTRCGRLIRKYKLDEFSQLINVLLGDMSLVGPRPEVQKFVDMYTGEEKAVLSMRPGITDWASIKFNNEGEIIEDSGIADPDEAYARLIRPEKLRLQLKYLKEHNLWVDLRIIAATLLSIVSTRVGSKRLPTDEKHNNLSANSM
ncbi:MAG: UDP-N-acetylgalactosamine-undecaprenyl-phosphate N-acetylgalactosaminephosphotransferase [Pelotomaculum sp. PtaU1.Bin065]|nr:MAG: UDP-N-acetylgalactosamine-undecaprenyl-phosphate N-acetylgalactosaminephosphotransferase [Pelotomaculum sp. PtaU1.Bin065]